MEATPTRSFGPVAALVLVLSLTTGCAAVRTAADISLGAARLAGDLSLKGVRQATRLSMEATHHSLQLVGTGLDVTRKAFGAVEAGMKVKQRADRMAAADRR